MNCKRATEHLSAYCDGELDPNLHREMALHIEGCPLCRKRAGQIRRIAEIPSLQRPPQAPPELSLNVMRRIREHGPVTSRAWFSWWSLGWAGPCLACFFALIALRSHFASTPRSSAGGAQVTSPASPVSVFPPSVAPAPSASKALNSAPEGQPGLGASQVPAMASEPAPPSKREEPKTGQADEALQKSWISGETEKGSEGATEADSPSATRARSLVAPEDNEASKKDEEVLDRLFDDQEKTQAETRVAVENVASSLSRAKDLIRERGGEVLAERAVPGQDQVELTLLLDEGSVPWLVSSLESPSGDVSGKSASPSKSMAPNRVHVRLVLYAK